jgi:pimeloyl-ACP methyl ester carboxylesterase
LLLMCVVLLPACTTMLDERVGSMPAELAAYAAAGHFEVDIRVGSYDGARCVTPFSVFQPVASGTGPLIVLAHGFQRDLESMRGWGELWASHGMTTVVVTLCNSSLLAGRHAENARDLLAVASQLGARQVVYAGFSAGGLSALLAANGDGRATGYLGLDPVDSGALAAGEIEQFGIPALVLLGAASACNARGNIEPVLTRMQRVTALRVAGSTHCHFENPCDKRCELARFMAARLAQVNAQAADSGMGTFQVFIR